ncbi:MAG TPA: tRNA preQ1(34) S-adenosylmethionine ribosyltransferase-isomerase QueA [bacterium]
MKLSDFKYHLPEELIAQYPSEKRDQSRLMILDRKTETIETGIFSDLIEYLNPGDCLVLNETKVFPARLKATKDKTDAQVEIFLLRELENSIWEVLVKPARKVRVGNRLTIAKDFVCDVIDNTVSGGRVVRFTYEGEFFDIVEKIGRSPLPPYIKRESEDIDKDRYQTVYAKVRGAVAAPTAGMHFTTKLLDKIKKKDVKIVNVLLHLGLGSFRPVIVEDLSRHKMDSEYFEISEDATKVINQTIREGKNIIAVGTSTVRVLESVVTSERMVKPMKGWTDKFIYPPYEVKIVDHMITNFHLPCSTLLMLVSAFAGRDFIFRANQKAIDEKWRFYSYGDVMLLL